MKFSVVVAFDNQYELMSNFVENLLLNTDFSEGELILVSDGCRDCKTLSYLKQKTTQFKWFKLIELEQRNGYGKANNWGVRKSCGEIVVFLNSDVLPVKGSVNALVQYVLSNTKIGAAQGKLVYPQNGLIQSTGHLFFEYKNAHVYTGCECNAPLVRASGARQALTTAFCAIPRSIFWEHGGFDEIYYNAYEGMELTLKISNSGKICSYFADAFAFHVVGGSRKNLDFDNDFSGHIFWERWKKTIRTDIQHYITPQITDTMLKETYFLVQSSSIPGWNEVIHAIGLQLMGVLELQERFSTQINFYQNLPYAALHHPQPYLFVVDELSYIRGNRNWVEVRNNSRDLVIDAHGLVGTLGKVTGAV